MIPWLRLVAYAAAAICAWSPVSATAEEIPRIVFLGDSITAGHGLDPDQAYPALIQKKISAVGLKYTVVNAGVGGDTTAGGLRRVDWVLGGGANVFVVALGGNDGLRGLPPEAMERNLLDIVEKAKAKVPGLRVVIAGMRMPTNMGQEFNAAYEAVFARVAEKTGSVFLPFLLEGVGGVRALNQPDEIHPTAKGQAVVAENVWKVLEPMLKPAGTEITNE